MDNLGPDVNKSAGKKIMIKRKEKKLTQDYMAQELNMSQPSYNRIESGETSVWINHLAKFKEILGLLPEELVVSDNQVVQIITDQQGGNANNIGTNVLSEKVFELYERMITELKEENAQLKKKYGVED